MLNKRLTAVTPSWSSPRAPARSCSLRPVGQDASGNVRLGDSVRGCGTASSQASAFETSDQTSSTSTPATRSAPCRRSLRRRVLPVAGADGRARRVSRQDRRRRRVPPPLHPPPHRSGDREAPTAASRWRPLATGAAVDGSARIPRRALMGDLRPCSRWGPKRDADLRCGVRPSGVRTGATDGSHEPTRQHVPPRGGRDHPHAHRIVLGLRRSGARLRRDRRLDRQQVAGDSPIPPEGALRPRRHRPPGVGRRPTLQPRVPRPSLRPAPRGPRTRISTP